MEMEHIDENTVRVTIGNDDLEERGITVLDLLGNQHKIEDFFYSILEEIDVDQKFKDTEMVTFQVIPSNSGLELYISKDGEIKEDFLEKSQEQPKGNPNKEKRSAFDEYFDSEAEEKESRMELVLKFDDFETLIALSKYFYMEDGLSFLHYLDETYHLTLIHFLDQTTQAVAERERAIALEFGNRSTSPFAVVEEYGEEIIAGNALETLRKNFNG